MGNSGFSNKQSGGNVASCIGDKAPARTEDPEIKRMTWRKVSMYRTRVWYGLVFVCICVVAWRDSPI